MLTDVRAVFTRLTVTFVALIWHTMASQEPIHSGHFMTSNPHNDDLAPDEEDEDVEVEVVDDEEDRLVPEDETETRRTLKDRLLQDEKPVTFYKFGPKKTQSIAIDVSLNKLNKCIKVAYNKMTTPKWKDFKGLRLHWKQRIRLNNVIWRAYYMEFRKPSKNKAKKTPYCYFAVPDDDTTHTKIEGSVLEGMYWKRRMEAVCAQYKRWRHFSKSRKKGRKRENSCNCEGGALQKMPSKSQTPKNTSSEFFDIDDLDNEFTDTLFDSLSQPYMFPNPKEMVQGCNADVMQPGLLSLQPSIEEIMASLDPPDPPQSGSDSAPPPSVSSSYTPKEYDAANLLVDYGNQTQPTRQPSSVSSQMLMGNVCAPTYSQAAYERIPSVVSVPFSDSTSSDYVPQFLTTSTLPPTATTMLPNRQWWMNFPPTPTPSPAVLASPSTPSPLVHNSFGPSSLSVNSPSSLSPLMLNSSTETLRASTPSKGALKAYPNPSTPQKLTERWTTMANASMSSSHLDIPGPTTTQSPWKLCTVSSGGSISPLPVPQPLYPQTSTHISPSPTIPMDTPTVPMGSPVPPPPHIHPGSALIKEEEEKEDRRLRSVKRSRSVAPDSTIEPVERKRILHLNAEQNRRSALKDGFDQLLNLLPNMYSAGTKPTNAVVLARAAEHIRELKVNIDRNKKKSAELEAHIQRLNDKIASLQASLPSSSRCGGTTVSQKALVEQFFDRYTKERSRQDFRFWLMAKMMQPIVESLERQLCEDSTSREAVVDSARAWLRSRWQPAAMRPQASSLLIYLATCTSMLSSPDRLQEHVQKEISKQ